MRTAPNCRVGLTALAFALMVVTVAAACPFCPTQTQTLTEEISTMDATVAAKLLKPGRISLDGETVELAQFEITEIIAKSPDVKLSIEVGEKIDAAYFGRSKPGQHFLVMASDSPNTKWFASLTVSDRSLDYLKQVLKLPEAGVERLVFAQKFLEDEDPLMARDAFDEFARAPYEDVIKLKPQMDRKKLLAWITDKEIPASRRRLYLTMLGVCGTEADLPMLEEMLKGKSQAGLDALIACYITLKGESGLPLIEELFLEKKDAEYSDTYAAIMALRFHGTDGNVVPKKRVAAALAHMLDRPPVADLVIPDLARLQDWSHVEKLYKLFVNADEKSSWVKLPVVNYLRACPLPTAKQKLAELKKLDPETFERANSFFQFNRPGAGAKEAPEEDDGA